MSKKNQTPSRSNTPNPRGQPTVTSVGSPLALTSVEEMPTVISQEVAYSIPLDIDISLPQVSNTPIFVRGLRNLGDQRPPYLCFLLP